MELPDLSEIVSSTPSKIVLLVIDGLGGMPHPDTGKSELETAHLPNLNALAKKSACGLLDPVLPGITPGSGPGHLALFGYNPVKDLVGRGVLEAVGVDVEVLPGEVAARGNFCTVDSRGLITDRRAGRIPTEESSVLCALLNSKVKVPGIQTFVYPVRDHRFAVIFRGEGLSERITETDPQRVGVAPLEVRPLAPEAARTAKLVNQFIAAAGKALTGRAYANMITLRGFSERPKLAPLSQSYKLKPAAIAIYPMYRGLARLAGMEVLPPVSSFSQEIDTLGKYFGEYDFFFLHYKNADAAGEDGDFARKVKALEDVDAHIPRILALESDVFVVTGDHSTPSVMASHSWHPVPVMIYTKGKPGDWVESFSERACAQGSLGRMPARYLMLLMLASAMKLTKFGA